jgi:hypothetical protein
METLRYTTPPRASYPLRQTLNNVCSLADDILVETGVDEKLLLSFRRRRVH